MQFKRLLLNGVIRNSLHRYFVSNVHVNVNSFKSLQFTSKDSSDSSAGVKLTILDGHEKEVDVTKINSIEVKLTDDEFNLECKEPNELSAVFQLPVTEPDVEISVNISGSSDVSFNSVQASGIKIRLKTGEVDLKTIKCKLLTTSVEHGNIKTNKTILAKDIKLITKCGNVTVGRSLGDEIEVEAEKIKIDSCFSKVCKFVSTKEAEIMNIHGEATIKATGSKFNCTGFSGKILADLNCDIVYIQCSEILGDSQISSSKADAQIKLGFSDDVVSGANFKISSDSSIDSYIDELMVYEENEAFLITRFNERCSSNQLTVTAKKAKSFEINTMSWIDIFKLTLFPFK